MQEMASDVTQANCQVMKGNVINEKVYTKKNIANKQIKIMDQQMNIMI